MNDFRIFGHFLAFLVEYLVSSKNLQLLSSDWPQRCVCEREASAEQVQVPVL